MTHHVDLDETAHHGGPAMTMTNRQRAAQQVGLANRKHGAHGSAEYRAWTSMKDRCLNPRSRSYARYGGRGIQVVDRWVASFEAFLADVGPRPTPGHSLDRIDNEGPYSPENCRWATGAEQQRNKRDARLVEWHGQIRSLADLAEERGLSRATVVQRLKRGWSLDDALDRMIDAKVPELVG